MWESLKGFYLKDLVGMSVPALVALIFLVVLGAALIIGGRQKWTARRLACAALCLAIAFVLSCIRLYRMPSGGSVVLCAILPLVFFSYYCGVWQGAVVCVAYGVLQILQGAWIIHPVQGFLDYIAAYGVLAVGGAAAFLPLPKRWKLPVGLILASVCRWAVSVISGLIFFSGDAIEAGQLPFVYSALYNSFLFPEAILCAVLALIPSVAAMLERVGTQITAQR